MQNFQESKRRPLIESVSTALSLALLSLALSVIVNVPDAQAQTDGQNGQSGFDGDPGTNGTDGGDGEDDLLIIDVIGMDSIFIRTEAGNGGFGGWGGNGEDGFDADLDADGGDAGNGGDGGNATSIGIADEVAGEADLSIRAEAGRGGFGGIGGQVIGGANNGQAGENGRGGDGGFAIAEGELVLATGDGRHRVDVRAIGGGAGSGSIGGQAGGASVSASGVALMGDLSVSASASGGSGGGGQMASDGASVSMVQSVSGSAAGDLLLDSSASGGSGGSAVGGGIGGHGGHATVIQNDETNELGSDINVRLSASSGSGGRGETFDVLPSTAGNGGDAYAEGSVYDTGNVGLSVDISAGSGGAFDGGQTGSDGGHATIGTVFAESLEGGNVSVMASIRGGSAGDNAINAGDASDVILTNAIDGETSGSLYLLQEARAGNGAGFQTGENGHVGIATSSLVKAGAYEMLTTITEANGGNGGRRSGEDANGIGAAGGAANAKSHSNNSLGDAFATAHSYGGRGTLTDIVRSGDGGEAIADAISISGAESTESRAHASARAGQAGNFGGDATNAVDADSGRGGNALATSYAQGGSTGIVNARSDAWGGDTSGTLGIGASAGTATAVASSLGYGSANVSSRAEAQGGTGQQFAVDDDGVVLTANAMAYAQSTGSGNATATAIQRASDRAYQPGEEGFGADSIMFNQATGSTTGRLFLTQESYAGRGMVNGAGDGQGRGGMATSIMQIDDQQANEVVVFSEAYGGRGRGFETAPGGPGGDGSAQAVVVANGATQAFVNARGGDVFPNGNFPCPPECPPFGQGGKGESSAISTSATGDATSSSRAFGGSGFSFSDGIFNYDAMSGNALAQATSTARFQNLARAESMAEGAAATAISRSMTSGGPIVGLAAGAMSMTTEVADKMAFRVRAGSGAGINEVSLPFLNFNGENTMRAIALPSMGLIETALEGNQNAQQVFEQVATASLYAKTEFNGATQFANNDATVSTIQTYLDLTIDTNVRAVTEVYLAFLDPTLSGNGFEELSFAVSIDNAVVLEESFDDALSASAYFDDKVLDLTQWLAGPSAAFDFRIQFDAVVGNPDDMFGIDFALVTVPLPGAVFLFLTAIGAMGFLRKR